MKECVAVKSPTMERTEKNTVREGVLNKRSVEEKSAQGNEDIQGMAAGVSAA